MAVYSDGMIKALKATSDVYGAINQAQVDLMNLLDPQWMNSFEILIYPQNLSRGSALDIAKAIAAASLDTTIARLHIQKISVPHIEYEFAEVNGMKHVVGIKHPDELTITFIENDLGLVRNYLQYWMNLVAVPNDGLSQIVSNIKNLGGGNPNVDPALTFDYRFKDNQISAKKNAKVIPQMGTGLPSPAWIQIEGLVYKGISEQNFEHSSNEPMLIDAKFSVDVVRIMALTNFLNG